MKKVDHESRRQDVAAAAARLIAEKGLEALTTRALARQLGCSIGVLSHYFKSKEDIVDAAFQWADQRIDERMAVAMLQSEQRIDDFIPVLMAGLPLDEDSDLEWRVRMNLYIYSLTDQRMLQRLQSKMQEFRGQLPHMLAKWQQEGRIRRDIPASRIADIAFDITVGAAQNLLRIPMEQRQAYAEYLFDLVEALRIPESSGKAASA